jgi:hypothetical protein
MSTPASTPGTPAPSVGGVTPAAKANITATAEVVKKKKNSMKFSPKHVESWHPYAEQGFIYMVIEVATGKAVKGFHDEDSCQKYCEDLNAQ